MNRNQQTELIVVTDQMEEKENYPVVDVIKYTLLVVTSSIKFSKYSNYSRKFFDDLKNHIDLGRYFQHFKSSSTLNKNFGQIKKQLTDYLKEDEKNNTNTNFNLIKDFLSQEGLEIDFRYIIKLIFKYIN